MAFSGLSGPSAPIAVAGRPVKTTGRSCLIVRFRKYAVFKLVEDAPLPEIVDEWEVLEDDRLLGLARGTIVLKILVRLLGGLVADYSIGNASTSRLQAGDAIFFGHGCLTR